MLEKNRIYQTEDYTYEVDGVTYPIRQVMEIQRKDVSSVSAKEVYGIDRTVSVRFDANGGQFGSNPNMVGMVDAFDVRELVSNEDGTLSLALLDPNDARRSDFAYEAMYVDYALAGWYTLDAEGNKHMWDFETDRVTVDANGSYTVIEPVLTLYALWQPYPSIEYYNVDEPNEPVVIQMLFNTEIRLPVWDETTGKMQYNSFPIETRKLGYTIKAVYYDAAKTRPVTESVITHPATVDADGTAENLVLKLYIEYIEMER